MTLPFMGILLAAGPITDAQHRSELRDRPKVAPKSPADLAADVARAMRRYRATLERALAAREADVREATEALTQQQRLYVAGEVSAEQLERSQRIWEAAHRDLTDLKDAIEEADQMIFAASVHEQLARLRPLPRGGYEETSAFVRFNGTSRWSLKDVPKLEAAFLQVFGRPLPISAFGQTSLHSSIGLDHRNAIDIAVHPDSQEGQWLIRYLRDVGISFVGVRYAVPGSSTGAHVHVGPASPRLTAR